MLSYDRGRCSVWEASSQVEIMLGLIGINLATKEIRQTKILLLWTYPCVFRLHADDATLQRPRGRMSADGRYAV